LIFRPGVAAFFLKGCNPLSRYSVNALASRSTRNIAGVENTWFCQFLQGIEYLDLFVSGVLDKLVPMPKKPVDYFFISRTKTGRKSIHPTAKKRAANSYFFVILWLEVI